MPQSVACGLIALLLLALALPVEARTWRHRKPTPVTVALQPFLLARTLVHTVADPIVDRAPRAIATVATAPLRIAYHAARDREPTVLRGESVPAAEFANQSVRVAYLVPRTSRAEQPEPEEEAEQSFASAPEPEREPENFSDRPTVAGNRAVLRGGIAYAPSRAPQSVKNAIWAANSLRRKPYVWGGGHGSFFDRGYDCSGTVSFALRGAGALAAPLPSSDFMRYGERGCGRWLTIYARPGHTFAVIAGLRLDTTDFQNGGHTGPRWHADARDTRGYAARHPAGM